MARKSVAIVGGGIAGLYVAYKLAQHKDRFEITVFEASPTFGGRIETVDMRGFTAEYGPMRFEPKIQKLLDGLRNDLGLEFVDFPSMGDDPASARSATERYDFRHDELRHSADDGSADVPPPRPLDLLRLGVLRMFRIPLCEYLNENPKTIDLTADSVAAPPSGKWKDGDYEPGKREWIADKNWNVPSDLGSLRTKVQEWLDHFQDDKDDEESSYTTLRKTATQRDRLMWNDSFWNAASRELGAPAIRYIRDEGTFYHLFPDNPNAVEWGIFWLRLFRTEATELKGIKGGTGTIIDKLVQSIEEHDHVRLRAAQEIVSIKPAEGCTAVSLRIRDHSCGSEYDAEADHCVLALPLAPLQRLATNFPEEIRAAIGYGYGFALLKCFLVVRKPWWKLETPTHAGAFGVPTRELHYHWRFDATDNVSRGMAMLYTDHPASQFWKEYVPLPVHDQAYISVGEGPLKQALVYHLLIRARRQAHLDLTQLLCDADANTGADGNVDPKRRREIKEYVDHLQKQTKANAPWQKAISDWHGQLIGGLRRTPELGDVARVFDVLRNPSVYQKDLCDTLRPNVQDALSKLPGRDPEWEPFERVSIDPVFESAKIEDQLSALGKTVEMCGIRDWSRWPVGGACHAWTKGAHSWEIIDKLTAFALIPQRGDTRLQNVHVCGEALSDYQGFIEGALRTAKRVVAAIAP
jgi:phytoene dehydrogenase-like protein